MTAIRTEVTDEKTTEPQPSCDICLMGVYERIHYAAKLIDHRIPKLNNNQQQGFKFASHDDVVQFCRPCLLLARLIITCSIKEYHTAQLLGKNAKGEDKVTHIFEGIITASIVNIDKPDDKYSVDVPAIAHDTSDKAAGKAFSYAKKYVLTAACGLLIPTGEDVDNEKYPSKKLAAGEKKEETKIAKKVLVQDILELATRLQWTDGQIAQFAQAEIGTTCNKAAPVQLQTVVDKMRDEAQRMGV